MRVDQVRHESAARGSVCLARSVQAFAVALLFLPQTALARQSAPGPWQPLPGAFEDGTDCSAGWLQRRWSGPSSGLECPCESDDPCREHCQSADDGWALIDCVTIAHRQQGTVDSGRGGMSEIAAEARIGRVAGVPGMLCDCSATVDFVPTAFTEEHLRLRVTPASDPAPRFIHIEALVTLLAEGRIDLGASLPDGVPCGSACGTVQANAHTRFAIPFLTPEIEQEIERVGLWKSLEDSRSHCGSVLQTGVGAGVSISAIDLTWTFSNGGRRAKGTGRKIYSFKAISCMIAPSDGEVVDWPFRLGHAVDAAASVEGADAASMSVRVGTEEFTVRLTEEGCDECSNPNAPQPIGRGGRP